MHGVLVYYTLGYGVWFIWLGGCIMGLHLRIENNIQSALGVQGSKLAVNPESRATQKFALIIRVSVRTPH